MTFSDSPSGSENRISVLVVDDHQVVRQGLRTFLELQPDIRVVGEAGDGETAVELVRQLQPDVVLMDLVMPQLDGIAATRQVKALGGQTKVIALTSFTEDDKVFPAIQAGASSYLLKDVSPDELVEAIRAAHRGEARLHPNVARKLMEQVQSGAPFVRQAHHSLPEELTGRELDVVRLVAQGCSNHQISQSLVISEKTVKTHISHILSKLQLEDRTQLAIYAIRHALVDLE
jgi:NarL family two-component system response regulator LiaR